MATTLVPAAATRADIVQAVAKPGGTNAAKKVPTVEDLTNAGLPPALQSVHIAQAVQKLGADTLAKFKAPNPYPLKRIPAKVLEEEDYVEALGAIIERDYFPDLPRLRLEQQILKAREAGQDFMVHKLRERLRGMTPVTPGHTPRTPAQTPGGMTPGGVTPGGSVVDLTGTGTGPKMRTLANGERCLVDTNVSLDQFQRKYTSEDNASFEEIVKVDKERRALTEWYCEGQAVVHNAERHQMTLAIADGTALEGAGVLVTTAQPRSSMHFYPQAVGGHVTTPSNRAVCDNTNTRLPTAVLDGKAALESAVAGRTLKSAMEDSAREAEEQAAKGKFATGNYRVPEHLLQGTKDNRYPMLPTPDMDPGEMTPLMTYGDIGATPLLLDDAHLPTYTMPKGSAKDDKAHMLAELAVKRARDLKRRERASKVKPWTSKKSILTKTGTPGSSRIGTPKSIFGRTPSRSIFGGTPATSHGGATPQSTAGATPRPREEEHDPESMPPPKRYRPSTTTLPESITDDLLK
jgi:protein DGCR14